MADPIRAALDLVAKMVEVRPGFERLSSLASHLHGVDVQHVAISECVYVQVTALIDAVLGEELGSYFLHECP